MEEFWNTRLIYKVYSGSIAYGTNTPDSDIDIRGVCIPPISCLLGQDTFEQKEIKEPDTVIYSLRKFIKLALQNNPNILEILFVMPNHIIFINELGEELRNIRYDFLSKKVYKTYSGYAYDQLKRMETLKKDAMGKRAENIKKYKYDTKNAMNLIKLLKMAIEILTEKEVNVLRHDNKELLDIKNGKYTVNEIKDEAKRLQNLVDVAYVNSKLPDKPNYNKINNWLISIHQRSLYWKGSNNEF